MRILFKAPVLSRPANKAVPATGNAAGGAASQQIDPSRSVTFAPAHPALAKASGSAVRWPKAGGAVRMMLTVLDKAGDLPEGAVQIGYHGTTKASLDGIAKRGYDMSRAGGVSGTGLGPGMYGSLSKEVASFYANRATDMHLHGATQEERTPVLVSVHTLPSEQQVAKTFPAGTKIKDARAAIQSEPTPHHAVHQKPGGNHEFVITSKGLADPDVQYFAIPEAPAPALMSGMRPHVGAFADDKNKK
jgi:hypothetical protein